MAQRAEQAENGQSSPHQTVNYNTVNNVGNTNLRDNYGNLNINQIWEEPSLPANIPIHPDIGAHLAECFPNSRTEDTAHIMDWINSKDSELVLCVLGKVGVGKSTLAKHLANTLRDKEQLGGEAYFGFASPDWTPESVIRMLAGQLSKAFPALMQKINHAIRLDGGPSVSIQDRFCTLILDPIQSLHLPHPLVVVIDALDQWQLQLGLIQALQNYTLESHVVRFVVMGRPGLETHFRAQNVSFGVYHLHEVSNSVMGAYFHDRFTRIQWEHGRAPESFIIQRLVEKADGLFIWTSTLCSLLRDDLSCPNPHQYLEAILRSHQSVGDTTALASLYHSVIGLQFPEPNHQAKLKTFLGALLVLQEPLPIAAFASLVSMDASLIRSMMERLRPFQNGDMRRDTIYPASSTFHLSLIEYLESTQTPRHLAFTIDTFRAQALLAEACIQEVHRTTYNQEHMSVLQKYAIRFWPLHTSQGTPEVTPDSDAEWKATTHFSLLSTIPHDKWRSWAAAYLKMVDPTLDPSLIDILASADVGLPAESRARQPLPALRKFFSATSIRQRMRGFLHRSPLVVTAIIPERSVVESVSLVLDSSEAAAPHDKAAVAATAVRLQPHSATSWGLLGNACYHAALASTFGGLLDRSVQAYRYAVTIGGEGGNTYKGNLAISLCERYQHKQTEKDLDEALLLGRAVLDLTPDGHPNRAIYLQNLAASLQSRFNGTAAMECLDEAILLHRGALLLRPPGHPRRSESLNNLAISLRSRFNATAAMECLDEAILLHREALLLRPPGHLRRLHSLRNLASSLHSHCVQTGKIESLDESVSLYRELLLLCPPGHKSHSAILNGLSWYLLARFEARGVLQDLEEAISMAEIALGAATAEREYILDTLAMALRHKPDRLQESLAYSRQAVDLNQDNWEHWMNLATILLCCHKKSPNREYVQEAQSACQRANSLCKTSKIGREKLEAQAAEISAILASLPPEPES